MPKFVMVVYWHHSILTSLLKGKIETKIRLLSFFSSITTTATCGEEKPELFCKLSAGSDYGQEDSMIMDSLLYGDFKGTGGQYCDVCDGNNPAKNHSIEFVKDGTERWWQSPPLSSNTATRDLNKVNITIDMHQVRFNCFFCQFLLGLSF